MTGQIKHFFASGNTSAGFYSLWDTNLQNLQKLYIITGAPGTGISSLIHAVGNRLSANGCDLEYVHNSLDEQKLDGLIAPEIGVGIVSGNYPHQFQIKYPGAVEEMIYLGHCWDAVSLNQRREEIIRLFDEMQTRLEKAFAHFAKAKEIHLQREAIYAQGIDFDRVNRFTTQLLHRLFLGKQIEKNPRVRKRFFGAATANGVVHFIDELTENMTTRIILKGKPGSGKSTLLKKLAAESMANGLDTDIYQCSFDPESVDMVIIPALKAAVLDGTDPHPIDPVRAGDEVVDLYELSHTQNIDRLYHDELQQTFRQYKTETKQAVQMIAKAKQVRDSLASIYARAVDLTKVDEIKENIVDTINMLAKRT